jgi:hypothetical protein
MDQEENTLNNQEIQNVIDEPEHKKKSVLYKKNIRCKKEREAILNKLYSIIGITESNRIFFSHQMTDEMQTQILAMKDEIDQNFKTSTWSVFRKETQKPALSLFRCVLRDMSVSYSYSSCKIKDALTGNFISSTLYKID